MPESPTASPTADLVLKDEAGLPVTYNYGASAGSGFETSHEGGGRIAFLSLLHPLSDHLKPGNEKYIPGAAAGDWALGSVKKSWKKVMFIGIAEEHVVVEKTGLSKSGKWVADHKPTDPMVIQAKANPKPGAKGWAKTVNPANGNVLLDTFRIYGVAVENFEDIADAKKTFPCVIGFDRSKLASRTQMMNRFRATMVPVGASKESITKLVPLHAVKLSLASKMQPNPEGDFPVPVITFAVNDDVLASLILPTAPYWAKWDEECKNVKQLISLGKIGADKVSAAAAEGGGEPDDADLPI